MKKFLLGFTVFTTFSLYAIFLRQQKTEAGVVTAPLSVTQTASPSATPISLPIDGSTPSPTAQPTPSRYRNGDYTGPSTDAFYGNVQVRVSIRNGLIQDVQFLDYPRDRETSIRINSQAIPYLKQEAIQAQSAQVDGVSGASQTSRAFQISLAGALMQAQ